jgi:hypothetical protein
MKRSGLGAAGRNERLREYVLPAVLLKVVKPSLRINASVDRGACGDSRD